MKFQITRFIVVLGVLLPGAAQAFNAALWLQEFYQNHDVKSFDQALSTWKSHEALEDIDARQPIVGFLSFAFAEFPEMIEIAIGDGSQLTDGEREAFALALHRAGTDPAKMALRKLGEETLLQQPTPPALAETEISEASQLDLCWGYFFGSGDVQVLGPVVAVLENCEFAEAMEAYRTARDEEDDAEAAKHREGAFRYAMYEAARWSLRFNAQRHPVVRRYLEQVVQTGKAPAMLVEQVEGILTDREEMGEEL